MSVDGIKIGEIFQRSTSYHARNATNTLHYKKIQWKQMTVCCYCQLSQKALVFLIVCKVLFVFIRFSHSAIETPANSQTFLKRKMSLKI